MSNGQAPDGKILRYAALFQILGIALLLVALLSFSPGTFVGFTVVGAPLMLGGMALYIWHVVRVLRERGAL